MDAAPTEPGGRAGTCPELSSSVTWKVAPSASRLLEGHPCGSRNLRPVSPELSTCSQWLSRAKSLFSMNTVASESFDRGRALVYGSRLPGRRSMHAAGKFRARGNALTSSVTRSGDIKEEENAGMVCLIAACLRPRGDELSRNEVLIACHKRRLITRCEIGKLSVRCQSRRKFETRDPYIIIGMCQSTKKTPMTELRRIFPYVHRQWANKPIDASAFPLLIYLCIHLFTTRSVFGTTRRRGGGATHTNNNNNNIFEEINANNRQQSGNWFFYFCFVYQTLTLL